MEEDICSQKNEVVNLKFIISNLDTTIQKMEMGMEAGASDENKAHITINNDVPAESPCGK